MTRYTYRAYHAGDNFCGRIDVTTTETLVEVEGGLRVDMHAVGTHEGNRVDSRNSTFWPGVTLTAACMYRDTRPQSYTRCDTRHGGE